MLKNTAQLFRKNFLAVVLVLICLFVAYKNYTPNTFLTGWDTLHPEFNFKLYWIRILGSVWQEHQGLGAVASQAHAAEIPRILLLQLMGLFIDISKLRYLYAFFMLLLGPLGVFAFLNNVLLKDFKSKHVGSFLGGLFYLFNLGTLQHFYVPLEMFLTHYGLLGWVFLSASLVYENGRRRDWAFFLLASFFIIPQAHTPTLFYAYFGALFLYVGTLYLKDRTKEKFWRTFTILVATLLLNAFWFLPHLYFVFNHGAEISQSKIHHLFSEEAFLQNQEFGHIQDVAILKNFLFNWGEHVGNGKFGPLLDEWKMHLENPYVLYTGYAYFVIVTFGLLLAIVRKNKFGLGLLSVSIFSLFFLLNNNPPFGPIFHYIQEHSALFKEVFRFPFTKFSILLILCYASFFAYAITLVCDYLGRFLSKYRIISDVLVCLSIAGSLFYYAQPMLTGHLISPSMRVSIPSRYFDLFSYMNKQPEYGRVANLPIDSFWGWAYYDWNSSTHNGYQGAGFLWFGIKQPLLNREFDRWDILNEQYYREMSTAVYSQNSAALKDVLDKYKITWLLLDESVIAPGADVKSLFYKQTRALFSQSKFMSLEKDFGAGLYLYRYSSDVTSARQEIIDNFVYSNDSIFKENDDPIYKQYGNYVVDKESNYPYLGITNFDESLKHDVVSSDAQNLYFANKSLSKDFSSAEDVVQFTSIINDGKLQMSPVQLGSIEPLPTVDIPKEAGVLVINGDLAVVTTNSKPFTFSSKTSVPINVAFYSLSNLLDAKFSGYASLVERCSGVEGGSSYGVEYPAGGFSLTAKDIVACVTLKLSSVVPSTPEILVIKSNIVESSALAGVCVFDEISGLCRNRPFSDGTTAAILDPKLSGNYLIRFLAYNVGKKTAVEGKVDFNDLQLFTGTKISDTKMSVIRTRSLSLGDRVLFKKDTAYAGNVSRLLSSPRLCNGGESNFEKSFVDSSSGNFAHYESNGESLCDSFQFPFVSHDLGSILEVTSRNIEGMPLRICLTNEYSKRCDLYVSLGENKDFETSYYIIPPMDAGRGYTVNVSNLVFGNGRGVNDLKYIALTPIPYSFFRSLHQEPPQSQGEKLLVLNEAYENGWTAFCGIKPCSAHHVMVNNWANGWVFEGTVPEDVRAVFFPQLLQYLGFMLLPLSFWPLRRLLKRVP